MAVRAQSITDIIVRKKQITRGRYNTKYLTLTAAGAESDLNAAAAAPSQTEVTGLNCSHHSTTSKKWPRDELWWVSIWHAFKIRLYDTLWCDCDTAAYDHSDPEDIGKTQGREKKDSERRSGFNQYNRRKQITRGRYNTKLFSHSYTRWYRVGFERYGEK